MFVIDTNFHQLSNETRILKIGQHLGELGKYSKTPQSADFGTEQNTADCENRRLRVLLYVVNGTGQNSKGPFFVN